MEGKSNIQTSMNITPTHYCNHDGTQVEKKTQRKWNIPSIRSIMMVLSTFYCQFMGVGVILSSGVLYPEILKAYPDEPKRSVAFIFSSCSGAFAVGGILSGMAINRFGTKLTLLFGAVVCSLGLVASYFANGVVFLIMSYGLVSGIGSCIIFMTSMVALRQHFGSEAKTPIMLASFGSGLGTTLMVQIIAGFVHVFAWRGSFFLLSCLFLQICVLAMALPNHRKSNASTASTKKPLIQLVVLKNLKFMLYVVFVFFYAVSFGMIIIVLLDYGKQMQFTEEQSIFLLTFVGLIGIPGRGFTAMVCHFNKFSSMITMYSAAVCLGCGVFFLKYGSSYDLALVFTFLIGFSNGMFIMLMWIVPLDMFSQENYASASGIVSMAFGGGSLVAGPIAGFVFDVTGSYDLAFQPLSGFLIIISVVLLVYELYRHIKQPAKIDTRM